MSALGRSIRRLGYILRDARDGLLRHPLPNVAALALFASALFVFSASLTADDALRGAAALLQAQWRMRAFLAEGTDAARAADQVRALPGVAAVRVETAEQALDRFRAAFPGAADLLDAFEQNPFPDTLVVDPAAGAELERLAADLADVEGVTDVIWAREYLPRLLALSGTLRRLGGLGLTTVFALAFLVTVMTVSLNVLHRQDEVDVRLLVGASPGEVRLQFAVEAVLLGLAGGAAGGAAGWAAVSGAVGRLGQAVPALSPLVATAEPGPIVALSIAVGALLAASASLLATQGALARWRDFR